MNRLHSVISLVALVVTCSRALAQTPSADVANYPERLVRLIVPFSAGSMTDIMARSIAEKLTTSWNQQVIVENRPGLQRQPALPSRRLMATR